MKATLCPDIRRFQFLPGAVEFNSTQRCVFIACPCGCGLIAEITGLWAQRDPIGIFARAVGPDGKNAQGDPAPLTFAVNSLGLTDVHWTGTLHDGEFHPVYESEQAVDNESSPDA
jgi:hypothetical protein